MNKQHLVAVYGSLLAGLHNHDIMKTLGEEHYEFVGETTTEPNFTLFPLGSFPGVHEGGNTAVKIEVYKVTNELLEGWVKDDGKFRRGPLDSLEGYSRDEPNQSMYIRKQIPTEFGDSWIYIYNGPNRYGTSIEDGDWKNYISQKQY